MAQMNKLSKILLPNVNNPKGAEFFQGALSKSQKLFIELGLVRSTGSGINVLLPIALRSINKLRNILHKEMRNVSAQEISLPTLTKSSLLKKTGRLDSPELFTLSDRHKQSYILSPTHEEAVTSLMANEVQMSWKHFPLRLYQITNKFRDEMKPKFGLLRSREFLMKDLYCFDTTLEGALESYKQVSDQYTSFFKKLDLPYVSVQSSPGDIGGSTSHEYHVLCDIGEDRLALCGDCGFRGNVNLDLTTEKCASCNGQNISIQNGIEVGHTFLLGTKYSEPLECKFKDSNGQSQLLHMSCYGIGLSRLLAASVEVLATEQEIRWPLTIAPYTVCLIPPKMGSKEASATGVTNVIYNTLNVLFEDDVVVDDNVDQTIGRRLIRAKRMGFPYVIAIGKSAVADEPKIEVHDVTSGTMELVSVQEVAQFLKYIISERQKTAIHMRRSVEN